MPVSYFEQLKTNLKADADAKKLAMDAIYDAYTQAQFDQSGNVSYKSPGKLGTRDVQYDTEKRNIGASGEATGTLRSGQQARNLATSMASYKADVLGKAGQLAADKSAVDTATATKIAEYQAMYGNTGTTSTGPQTPKTPTTQEKKIEPVPKAKGSPQGPSLLGPGVFKPTPKKAVPKKAINPGRTGGF